jgi:adenosylcobinamide-phosphate synthase
MSGFIGLDPGLVFAAVLADALWGGQFYLLHPVRAMGGMGRMLERSFLGLTQGPFPLRLLGVALVVLVSGTFVGGSVAVLWGLSRSGLPVASDLLTVLWGYQLLAGRSLETHVRAVLAPLEQEDLPGARRALSSIVGRDTEFLDGAGVIRGALESLSENANDALTAPLFFFYLGGIPALMGYKAVSTMDSQVGYKTPPYRDLGWASARLDDILAFVPARLTLVILIAWFGAGAARDRNVGFGSIVREAWGYRMCHPSPNSGLPMSAFAALLGIRMGGGAAYVGRWVEKPWIGEGRSIPTVEDLRKGVRIFRHFRWGLCILAGAVWLVSFLFRSGGVFR